MATPWAARHNTWLLMKPMLTRVGFFGLVIDSFMAAAHSRLSAPLCQQEPTCVVVIDISL